MTTETINLNSNNTVTPATARVTGKGEKPSNQMLAIIISAAIAIIGIGLWLYQVVGGFQNTNMRNLDSWGLYIMAFMLFVGLSAGGLIISSVPRVFNIDGFGGISKVAIWGSICCTILAMTFVVEDIGNPQRIWRLIATPNLTSPLIWDVGALTLYLLISIVYLRMTLKAEAGKTSPKRLRIISVFALICAIMVHTVTAWIISLQRGREMWYTALMGPWFVVSALLSGLAFVLLVVLALRRVGYLQLEQSYVVKMLKLLGVFTIIDLYFFACDLLTAGYSALGSTELVRMILVGPLAPFFWTEVIFGAITMLVAFWPRLRTTPLIVTASVMSILGVFCKRIQLVEGGFQLPNINYAQVYSPWTITDYHAGMAAYDSLVYYPSLLEVGVFIGVIAMGVFLMLMGLRFLPLKPTEKSH